MIAEDDLMLADLLEMILVDGGHEVCGICRTVSDAIALGLEARPDVIIIDVRLANGGLGPDIASALAGLEEMAVLYATGNLDMALLTPAVGHGCIVKPYRAVDLLRSIDLVRQLNATGETTGRVPGNFRFLGPHAGDNPTPAHG